ncbi:MAG: hypothetical protein WC381_10770 [Kiritimatiellia bacterium]|jgi:hypothetical protein
MEPTNEASSLAAEHKRLVDRSVGSFDVLVLMLGLELGRARTERESHAAIEAFLAALALLLREAEQDLGRTLPELMFQLWPLESATVGEYPQIRSYGESLTRLARSRLEDIFTVASMGSLQTGGNVPDVVASLAAAPMLRLQLHRAADAALSSTGQASLYLAGRGHYPGKQAIPLIDERTTPLCRSRMAYQIRPWDEPFRDPATGASWQFPPFVYGGLPSGEAFHDCRTSIAPVSIL